MFEPIADRLVQRGQRSRLGAGGLGDPVEDLLVIEVDAKAFGYAPADDLAARAEVTGNGDQRTGLVLLVGGIACAGMDQGHHHVLWRSDHSYSSWRRQPSRNRRRRSLPNMSVPRDSRRPVAPRGARRNRQLSRAG